MVGPIPACPPSWLTLGSVALTSFLLGGFVGWRSRDWRVFVYRHYDHDLKGGTKDP